MTESALLTTADRAIAAWESAAVQTLNPVLDDDTAAAMWAAITAHRTSGDAAAFAGTARALVATSTPAVRTLADIVIDNLTAVHRANAAAQD